MNNKSKVIWQKDGLNFKAVSKNGFSFPLGITPNENITPSELVSIGLIGCTAFDVISILQKKRVAVDEFYVECYSKVSKEIPKRIEEIHVTYFVKGSNINGEDVKRAITLSEEKYCMVRNTLKDCVIINSSYEILT